ncbi:hypothetical protein F542_4100 [Bibersteinia trehalosi USDA-ARS-USMARC-188]|uniref:Uncharacterized protein n=1 Tax=Bibersteinia trehalosi USDA-ARS-USMARC-188 TaxID=1263829 RepID=A0A4V7I7X6_BIBTR|nr:hypothetical protein F542_4100 [Bibersteinia trehalosi USDA-ARS-USMARC-188]
MAGGVGWALFHSQQAFFLVVPYTACLELIPVQPKNKDAP